VISDRDLVAIQLIGSPYSGAPIPRERGERWIVDRASAEWELVPVPTCRCCGEPAWPNLRCTKHQDRNPCAAEGCRRTRKAGGDLRDDASLCGEHWRAFVPPGSPIRQAFNRLARLANKMGYRRADRWPPQLEDRWWRLWAGVMRRVRRQATGHIDQAAIARLFGWDHEE
jgi:hypothetical protein